MSIRRPSTSGSATAKLQFPDDLVTMLIPSNEWRKCAEDNGIKLYTLNTLVGDNPEIPTNSYALVGNWISGKLQIPLTNISCDKEVKEFQAMTSLFTSTNMRPDVVVRYQQIPVLCIEVHSSPYEQTIDKMAWVLIQHLRWLRSLKNTVTQCVGFVFPKSVEPTLVTKVSCRWDAKDICFELKYFPLHCDDVACEVQSVYTAAKDMCNGLVLDSNTIHVYGIPLCEKTLDVFGPNSIQLSAQRSFVIQSNNVVYKYSFDVNERENIIGLYLQAVHGGERLDRCLLPHDMFKMDGKIFMKYKQLLYPMSYEEVKSCFRAFVESVCEAVNELHSKNMAHLDIRLENICFCPQTHEGMTTCIVV